MRTLLFILGMVVSVNMLIAQQEGPNIVFDNLVHDYGTIKEEAGKVSHKFTFTNTGSQPLVITRVQATCGCTTSDYTKQPITTGQKGFVEAVFDPAHRPGPFAKTVNIYSNAVNPTTVLTIKGTVTPKPRTIEDDFPQLMGDIRMQNNQFSFMNVKNTEVSVNEIPVINVGANPVSVEFENIPAYIVVEMQPKELKPNERGVLKATLDAKKVNDLGFLVHRMYILINKQKPQNSMISISAVIKEDFSQLSAKELENAPKITFTKTDHDFGTLKTGAVTAHEFTFKNDGKSPLIIRKVKTGCGCTATNPPTESIKPGESSNIKVTFNTHGRSGRQAQYIDVYCNDPKQPEIKLKIGGLVEKGE
jgi:hypothetical protein